jgi:hypothetical protein
VPVGLAGPYESKAGCKRVSRVREMGKKAGKTVAKVIEFYIPSNFRNSVKWVPPERRGKIIEFASQIKKSA